MAAALCCFAVSSAQARFDTETYRYDDLGRLISVTYANGQSVAYSYDDNGNRTQQVTVLGNRPPTAAADSVSTNKNTPVSFDPRGNDSDPDGSTLTIIATTNGANGAVVITGGGTGLTYTPNAGFGGADSFTYTVSDGALTATATVFVTVNSLDETPDALDWSDLWPAWNGHGGTSSTPNWVDSQTLTISGLSPGVSITIGFAQDSISAGNSGLNVQVYKNGSLVTNSLSIPDAAQSGGHAVGVVSVSNGDTLKFKAIVFDTTLTNGTSERSARQLIYNRTTQTLIDTFWVYGTNSESPGYPCPDCPETGG
ncbi:Ig-like domain-containing protein [Caulobacter mirabilis]|uniref:Ig-like domain-containing protein n=1 Tax=Caulobacter mirabilis TaxID=69666 RepID=UPI0015592FE7|nr:Ig-like domain-containing protein [Caulobacter mirabilis]